jgi:hypothetical protein
LLTIHGNHRRAKVSIEVSPINKKKPHQIQSSHTFNVTDVPSGLYFLVAFDKKKRRHQEIYFFIRPNASPKKFIGVVYPSFTEAAYNTFGGNSFYKGGLSSDLFIQSFQTIYRIIKSKIGFKTDDWGGNYSNPILVNLNIPNSGSISRLILSHMLFQNPPSYYRYKLHSLEILVPLLNELKNNDVAFEILTSMDLHENSTVFQNASALLFTGHDEYWSKEMRQHAINKINQNKPVIVLSGNFCWKEVTVKPNKIILDNQTCHWGDGRRPIEADFGLSFRFSGYDLDSPYVDSITIQQLTADEIRMSNSYVVLDKNHPIFKDVELNENNQLLNKYAINHIESDGLPIINRNQINRDIATNLPPHIIPLAKGLNYRQGLNPNIGIIEIRNSNNQPIILNLGSIGWTTSIYQGEPISKKNLINAITYLNY